MGLCPQTTLSLRARHYTPSQFVVHPAVGSNRRHDYFDAGFFGNFNSGVEAARPFLGNLNAPGNRVGIMAGDACNVFWKRHCRN